MMPIKLFGLGAAGGDHMDDSDGEADTADNVAADAAVASETSDTSLITFSRHAGKSWKNCFIAYQ